MAKAKALDPLSGREVEVDSPNVRRTFVKGTIQIPDGAPILMPVDYALPGKDKQGKMWLLVARPFIRIEEEAEAQGERNLDRAAAIGQRPPPKRGKLRAAKRL